MNIVTKTESRTNTAFTLIDVLIGMGVLGVVTLSLFASFTFGFNVVKLSREDVRATQLLHERMETIRLYNWDQVSRAGFIPATFEEPFGSQSNFFQGRIIVTNVNFSEPYETNLAQVIVNLSWTNNGRLCSRSVNTLVSRYGLQRYIFDFK